MPGKLKIHTYFDVAVAELKDKALDASNSELFKKNISPVLEANEKVVIDLSRVEFIDSSGCGAVLSCLKRLGDRGGRLRVCGVQQNVQRTFELVRMDRIIEIYPYAEDAVRGF